MALVDFAALTDSDPTPTLLVAVTGAVLGANSAARQVLGGAVSPDLLAAANNRDEILRYLRECSATTGALPGALRLHTPSGTAAFPCTGAAVRETSTSKLLAIVLRLRETAAHRAFGELTEHIERLNAEVHGRREAERHLSLALQAARMGTWTWDRGSDILTLSPRAAEIFGVTGRSDLKWSDIAALVGLEQVSKVRASVLATLPAGGYFVLQYPVGHPDGSTLWIDVFGRANIGRGGRITSTAGVVMDVSARKANEDRLRLLAAEVDHRARNMLATMHAIVRMTRAQSIEDYSKAIIGRLFSLAKAHTLIADSGWVGVPLRSILQDELAPYTGKDMAIIELKGPDVTLDPSSAQAFALALHELATNAAKYGSLSQPDGRLGVEWNSTGGMLALQWVESSTRNIVKPTHEGFGTKLISSVLTKVRGSVTYDWRPGGLRCQLTGRIAATDQPGSSKPNSEEASPGPEAAHAERSNSFQ